jgi:hypothetical protein
VHQHTKRRLGRQRGPKVAQIELSRKLTEAIWHMLTRNQPFAPAGAGFRLALGVERVLAGVHGGLEQAPAQIARAVL